MAAKAPKAPPAPWRNRIVGSGEVDPAELTANPANWRVHGKEQRRALQGALHAVGWVQQVIVNRTTGHIVDGHARVEEALARSEATVPVVYVELTEAEEALALATIDPLSAMATRDDAKLGELVAGISVDDGALRRLLGDLAGVEERTEGLTDPDELPPIAEEPRVLYGDLWALGDHRLLVGDATIADDVARLTEGGQAAVLWTDPPYGIGYTGGTEERLTIENDRLGPDALQALVTEACRLAPLAPGGVFYIASPAGAMHLPFLLALVDAELQLRQTLIWVKDRFVLGRTDFHYRHEPVLYGDLGEKDHEPIAYGWAPGEPHAFHGGRRLDTVWEIPRPSASREHPTMKPVDLVARALEYSSRRGDHVYDAFAGSGSTLIAAEQLGRRCWAMEIDRRYAQVIIDRWELFTGRAAERLEAGS